MARAEQQIVVDAPLDSVYAQWTQFPRFMEGVDEVHQIDDRHLHWRANIGGREVEWDAEIREQVPNDKIVWRSIDGATNAGWVTFRPVDAERTEVHLELSYEPEGMAQLVGDALGMVEGRVKGDLERFKEFIEERQGQPTGAWDGEIENRDAPGGHTAGMGALHDTGAGDQQADRDLGER